MQSPYTVTIIKKNSVRIAIKHIILCLVSYWHGLEKLTVLSCLAQMAYFGMFFIALYPFQHDLLCKMYPGRYYKALARVRLL